MMKNRFISDTQKRLLATVFQANSPESKPAAQDDGILSCPQEKGFEFWYVANPDGTIRWIFPKSATEPLFLSLYNANTLKATAFRVAASLALKTGTTRFIASGDFALNPSSDWKLMTHLQAEGGSFAVFTGTAGAYRKTVIAMGHGKRPDRFMKLAHTEGAERLISNEKKVLHAIAKHTWNHIEVPKVYACDLPNAIVLSNVRPQKTISIKGFCSIHLKALKEMWSHPKAMQLSETDWYEGVSQSASVLSADKFNNDLSKDALNRVIAVLQQWRQEWGHETRILTSLTHGDFTPWNMYGDGEKLYVYDWEMATWDFPLYFDFFHFIYQSEILIYRTAPTAILAQIQTLAPQMLASGWEKMHKLYLFIQLTRTLSGYAQQSKVLTQAHWMLDCWNEILPRL